MSWVRAPSFAPFPVSAHDVESVIAALILAGGAARRMGGGDKPLLELAGTRMIERIVAALGHPRIAISANGDPARFAAFGPASAAGRRVRGRGAAGRRAGGAGLGRSAGRDSLLTVPGDTPFIPRGLAAVLAPAPCLRREHGTAAPSGRALAGGLPRRAAGLLAAPGPRDVAGFAARNRDAAG